MRGSESRLVFSIDIGSWQSAVAVFYRKPGARPIVTCVARWPGQNSDIQQEKVPSVLLYNAEGELAECGAGAISRENTMKHDWAYVENFKMHLYPTTILEKYSLPLGELPPHVSLLKVYSNFLQYLFDHTRTYLRDSTGSDPWDEQGNQAEFILTHPSGWGTPQQQLLRKAAAAAGLVPAGAIKTRLRFLGENEAFASFCMMMQADLAKRITAGSQFIVCDAGGTTTDISAYRVKEKFSNEIKLTEIGSLSCIDGSARIDESFRTYLQQKLRTTPDFKDKADIPDILCDAHLDFERDCKRTFESPSKTSTVRIGPRSVNIRALQIKRGVLTLYGHTVEQFFKTSVDAIVEDIQRRLDKQEMEFMILTGGFGKSPYLKSALKTRLKPKVDLVTVDCPNSTAVALGGLRLGPVRVAVSRTSANVWSLFTAATRQVILSYGPTWRTRNRGEKCNPLDDFLSNIEATPPADLSPSDSSTIGRVKPSVTSCQGPGCTFCRTWTVREFYTTSLWSEWAVNAKIAFVEHYVHHNLTRHRILILQVTLNSGGRVYIHVDRRRDRGVSVRSIWSQNAKDTIVISSHLSHLPYYDANVTKKATMVIRDPLPLRTAAEIFCIVATESPQWTVIHENCWFFVSIIEEAFLNNFGGRYESGSLDHSELGGEHRKRILTKIAELARAPPIREHG